MLAAKALASYTSQHRDKLVDYHGRMKSRADNVTTLERIQQKQEDSFDILIIGGGSAGAGAALDAVSRGLKTICVEREDFASGTSSRSTKLIWGGSRYLVQALVSLFSKELLLHPIQTIQSFQSTFHMVMSCHRERKFLLLQQPHLTTWVPIAVPLKEWILWPPPFGYPLAALGPLGLFPLFFKFYDSLSGFSAPPSHIMTPTRAARKFPQLSNHEMKYCSIFYEGMHDDARTNLAIALTAAEKGATMMNYCEVVELLHGTNDNDTHDDNRTSGYGYDVSNNNSNSNNNSKVIGAVVCDKLTGKRYNVFAKSVLLCGGPFTDALRKLEPQTAITTTSTTTTGETKTTKSVESFKPAVTGSSGVHIILPSYFTPPQFGFVDMATSDGRFLFFLPWQNHVVVGTTDSKCDPNNNRPEPSENEVLWLLHEASKYLSPELQLQRKHVLSAWKGIRPLAVDPHTNNSSSNGSGKKEGTATASRDHIVSFNPETGVVFLAGGKWTTYREMAEDGVDKVIEMSSELRNKARTLQPCQTLSIDLVGKEGFSLNLAGALMQQYSNAISYGTAQHLVRAYGGRAQQVLETTFNNSNNSSSNESLHRLLVPGYPYIEAEVLYAIRHEYAVRLEDILARRTRLAFLNRDAALAAIPRVVELMAKELNWSNNRKAEETQLAVAYMQHFGGPKPLRDEKTARLATITEVKNVFEKLNADKDQRDRHAFITDDMVAIAAELLSYPLTEKEIKDCIDYCHNNDNNNNNSNSKSTNEGIAMATFAQWWNSDRFNPQLLAIKEAHSATASKVKGSGTMFG